MVAPVATRDTANICALVCVLDMRGVSNTVFGVYTSQMNQCMQVCTAFLCNSVLVEVYSHGQLVYEAHASPEQQCLGRCTSPEQQCVHGYTSPEQQCVHRHKHYPSCTILTPPMYHPCTTHQLSYTIHDV